MNNLVFLSPEEALHVQESFGTPVFVYDEASLEQRAREVLAFPNRHGLTARYAMKALPNGAVVRRFTEWGLHIDASSGFEAERAMAAGVAPEKIQLTAQELPANLKELVERGVLFNACSLLQLESYGKLFPGTACSVRINPGLGSGHSNRTNVGGPSSSFGIWHEHVPAILDLAKQYDLRITSMHTHIGSGSDPETWVHVAQMSLAIAAQFPEVVRMSLGGGYKVARMDYEVSADLQEIGSKVLEYFAAFEESHGRKLHLEVEPGTYLVANAGALVASVIDVVNTGKDGREFIKIDAGMTEILRPSLYGAQHPISLISRQGATEEGAYLIVGHCCESGDILSPEKGDPEGLLARQLNTPAVGDAVVIDGAGAYCAAMASKNYNSFPECAEVLRLKDGRFALIRRRQRLEQITENEVSA